MNPKKKAILFASALILALAALMVTTRFAGNARAVQTAQEPSYAVQDSLSTSATVSVGPETRVESDSMIWPLLKLVGALILVIGGIYGFLYVLKKMMGTKLSSNKEHRLLEVLETTYIAQKKSVSLIRVADRAVLVGVTEGSITPLAELGNDETSKILNEFAAEKAPSGFKNILGEAKERFKTLNMRKTKPAEVIAEIERPQTV
jgi:flagellar biosynthetic protein FliO